MVLRQIKTTGSSRHSRLILHGVLIFSNRTWIMRTNLNPTKTYAVINLKVTVSGKLPY